VLGDFPKSDDDTIIPMELIEMSMLRDVFPIPGADIVWGVDVAYLGADRSALVRRKGNAVLERPKWKRGLDTMQTAGWIKAEWDATPVSERPVEIMVDVIGYGAGVNDRLRQLGLPSVGVNVSETPAVTSQQYPNLRTELWYQGREWFSMRDCVLPERLTPKDQDMEDFVEELAAQTYELVSSGKTAASPKKTMRKKLGRSPDLADAFLLTFASQAGRALYGYAAGNARGSWGQPIKRNLKSVV